MDMRGGNYFVVSFYEVLTYRRDIVREGWDDGIASSRLATP
jgi:hypothetical protein